MIQNKINENTLIISYIFIWEVDDLKLMFANIQDSLLWTETTQVTGPKSVIYRLKFLNANMNKLSSYSVLRKVLKKLWISTPPNYLKRLGNESNINTICLLYDIRKTFKIS